MKRINQRSAVGWALVVALPCALAAGYAGRLLVGKQPDGSFIVATGQRIDSRTIEFDGRPIDQAMHPTEDLLAVVRKGSVLLIILILSPLPDLLRRHVREVV
jgi:hypothetical protein